MKNISKGPFGTTLPAAIRLTASSNDRIGTKVLLTVAASIEHLSFDTTTAIREAVTTGANTLKSLLTSDASIKQAILAIYGDAREAAKVIGVSPNVFDGVQTMKRFAAHEAIDRTLKSLTNVHELGVMANVISVTTVVPPAKNHLLKSLHDKTKQLGVTQSSHDVVFGHVLAAAVSLTSNDSQIATNFGADKHEIAKIRKALAAKDEQTTDKTMQSMSGKTPISQGVQTRKGETSDGRRGSIAN